jgi:2-polyprenyl-6-methoxyphenol hydroxylase-like FAD-dependent oxidoreductase
MSLRGQRAVVVGAGIAGLAAARALADRYGQVVVCDRDLLPDRPDPRRGVPQGHHVHVLLGAGQAALEGLFPGLHDDLLTEGATDFDPGLRLRQYRYGRAWPRNATGLRLVSAGRPLLEHLLRQHLAATPGVELRPSLAVTGLIGDGQRVNGVALDDGGTLPAALVVDATGRGSRSDRWLTALGCATPAVTEVKVAVGYASRLYRRGSNDIPGSDALFALPDPPREKRCGVVLPLEGDRWLVSLGGWHGSYPRDEKGFLEHARSLAAPELEALLETCEPLGDITVHQYPVSRRRRFEELAEVPAGYAAMGDAFCSVNPIYGQGMTCAAMAAVELGSLLDQYRDASSAWAAAFYRRAAEIVAVPWSFAVGGDFAYPETEGERPRGIALANAYSRRVQLASMVDPEIRRLFGSVQHLLTPPSALRAPSVIWRVLRASGQA